MFYFLLVLFDYLSELLSSFIRSFGCVLFGGFRFLLNLLFVYFVFESTSVKDFFLFIVWFLEIILCLYYPVCCAFKCYYFVCFVNFVSGNFCMHLLNYALLFFMSDSVFECFSVICLVFSLYPSSGFWLSRAQIFFYIILVIFSYNTFRSLQTFLHLAIFIWHFMISEMRIFIVDNVSPPDSWMFTVPWHYKHNNLGIFFSMTYWFLSFFYCIS